MSGILTKARLKILNRTAPRLKPVVLDIPGKMFSKPFRVKSNTMMRNSDKRKLRADLESYYGAGFTAVADTLLPVKSEITAVSAMLHREEETVIYCVEGEPMFFLSRPENVFLPTLYALWKSPGIMPTWFTGEQVIPKLQGGADLMLPGVIMNRGIADGGLGQFRAGQPRSIATPDNLAPVAVGITATGSMAVAKQLVSPLGLRGKGLLVKHTLMDHLWLYGKKTARPSIPFTDVADVHHAGFGSSAAAAAGSDDGAAQQAADAESCAESCAETGAACAGGATAAGAGADAAQSAAAAAAGEVQSESGMSAVEQMDEQLERCFLLALSCRLHKGDLPVLTSKFYGTFMQSCCRDEDHLDIKHSSHKKLSRFLAAMHAKFPCFTVKEVSKGVDHLTAVNWADPTLRQAKAEGGSSLPSLEDESEAQAVPAFSLFLSPSVDLMPVFSPYGHAKDALLTDNDVKQVVTQYVRDNDLVDEKQRSVVHLNDALSKALRTKGQLSPTVLRWDELMKSVKAKMLSRHQIVTSSGISVLHKGGLQPITISTALRSGNKTVTLVDNVELYGIEAKDLSERMQYVMASSASVQNKAAKGKIERQVLVQGNAINAVTDMLRDHYHVPVQAITVQAGKGKKPGGGKGRK